MPIPTRIILLKLTLLFPLGKGKWTNVSECGQIFSHEHEHDDIKSPDWKLLNDYGQTDGQTKFPPIKTKT